MRTAIATLAVNVLLVLPMSFGADVWVDNRSGSDANPGSRAAPFKSAAHALRQIKPGTTLHLRPTAEP